MTADTRLDHWLESILVEGPGRASAALLSVVSGYLAALTLLQRNSSVGSLYKRRFQSIIVPMIFWGALTCLVYLVLGQGDALFVEGVDSWLDRLNLIFFITEAPYGPTLHLGFLRDLFVCVLLSPLILAALKLLPVPAIAALVLVYLLDHSGHLLVILRPLVILGFAVGMLLALRKTRLDRLDRYWAWFLSLTGVFTVLIIWTNAGLLISVESFLASHGISLKETILYPLCRLSGSLAIWCMLSMVSADFMGRYVEKYSTYLFAAFCSHFLVLNLLFNGFWLPVVGDRDAYAYLLWFVTAPAVAMIMAVAIVRMAALVYPPLASLITGGRVQVGGAAPAIGGRVSHAFAALAHRVKKPRQIPAGARHPW